MPLDPVPPTLEGSALVNKEIIKLEPDAIIELFILDASLIGGEIFYFHAGVNKLASMIVYQGKSYFPIPVQVTGFEFKAKGELPRPHITFSNIGGFMKNLVLLYDDLAGALLVRRRVFAKFLDGQPGARADGHLPDDVFSIDRKVNENRYTVEFELGTAFEVEGVTLPRRQVMSGLCPFFYRGDGCFFAQKRYVAAGDNTYTNLLKTPLVYYGYWDSNTNYRAGNAVTEVFSDYENVYVALTANKGFQPSLHSDKWAFRQKVRYLYKDSLTYVTNDVVYIYGLRKPTVPLYFMAHSSVPAGKSPPNKNYWYADECSKQVPGCNLRFDPLTQRLPLPFGGFPGTVRIPDTV